jgi:intermembrane space import and assembly protein 40
LPADIHQPPETKVESETSLTLDSIAKRKQQKAIVPEPTQAKITEQHGTPNPSDDGGAIPGSPEGLEEEAGSQGAFNEETGEINWDCPCLNGMAHGPCGENFRAAFSCFVFSKEEPKGVDCIEKFK